MKTLAEHFPNLLKEWDYNKNIGIDPYKIGCSSKTKVWWICPVGHNYYTSVGCRTRLYSTNCPICSGQKVMTGYNDLKTKYPEIAKEWDYEKNYPLRPENVMPGSSKKAWWICPKGHSYYSVISNRRKGVGCAICKNKKVLTGYNDLATTRPDLLNMWNYEKNDKLGIKPTEVTAISGKKVWWKCENGDEWENTIAHISYGERCPFCSERTNAGQSTSFPEQAIYYYLKQIDSSCLNRYKYKKKYEIDVYIKNKNIGIEYDGYKWHSTEVKLKREVDKNNVLKKDGIKLIRIKEINKREKKVDDYYLDNDVYYLNNDNYIALSHVIENLLLNIYGIKRTIDINADRLEIYNQYLSETARESVAINEKLMAMWDYEKNLNVKPENFTRSSGKVVWWKCKNGHSFKKSVHGMVNSTNCPECFNQRFYNNRFGLKYPELLEEWDYEKNKNISPDFISCGSSQLVWWKCDKNHSWRAPVANRIKGIGCPYCSNQKVLTGFNDIQTLCPDLMKEWDFEKNVGINPSKTSIGTSKKVWWKCSKCGYEWQSIIYSRTKNGTGCTKCARVISDSKHYSNSPEMYLKNNPIMSEYDFEKNKDVNLEKIRIGSKRKLFWKCSKCGFEYMAHPYEMTKGTKKCKNCKQKNKTQHNFLK